MTTGLKGERTMTQRQRQVGASIPTILLFVAMLGFFVMCIVKMTQPYLEYLSIREIIGNIAQEHRPEEEGIDDIRRRIRRTFNTNQIYGLKPSEVEVFREEGKTYIDANYEARVHLFANIDVVMKFEDLKYLAGTTVR